MHSSQKLVPAAVAALALTLGGLAAPHAAAAPVGAEPTPTTAATIPATGKVDPTAATTLTIHKILGDPNSGATTPLKDRTFNVYKLIAGGTPVDLTTQEGWQVVSALNDTTTPINASTLLAAGTQTVTIPTAGTDGVPGTADDGTRSVTVTLGPAVAQTTDANGIATFSTLGVGAFLVEEVSKTGYTTAAPFLVTLPHGETGTWKYTQDVYPKNQMVQPNKQVDDTNATLGNTLTYTINAPVPADNMDRFTITDPLPTGLTLVTASPVVTVSNADGTGDVSGNFTAGTDYTIGTANNTVTVTFTQTGLDKLEAARKGNVELQVHVQFKATVTSVPAAGGTITNTATVALPNGGTITTDADFNGDGTVDKTSTTFAPLTITKTSPTAGDLSGATFQLYQCSKNADGTTWQLLGAPLDMATSPTGPTATTITTGADAKALAYAIPATSTSGGATGAVANQYCVMETKAPAGYLLNPQPQPVTYDGNANTLAVSVTNAKDTVIGQLPATGAWGLLAVLAAGGGLVARGVATSRRDRKADAA